MSVAWHDSTKFNTMLPSPISPKPSNSIHALSISMFIEQEHGDQRRITKVPQPTTQRQLLSNRSIRSITITVPWPFLQPAVTLELSPITRESSQWIHHSKRLTLTGELLIISLAGLI